MTLPTKIAITLILFILLFPTLWLINFVVQKHGQLHRMSAHRIATMSKLLRGGTIFLALGVLGGIWQVNISGIAIYLGSFFTIVGVSFLSQWSLFSSMTASVILFFNFPLRIGSRVRVLSGDDTVEGVVKDITLFSVKLIDDSGNEISFANNVIIQKPVIRINQSSKAEDAAPASDAQATAPESA